MKLYYDKLWYAKRQRQVLVFRGKKKSEETGRRDDAKTKVMMGTAIALIP